MEHSLLSALDAEASFSETAPRVFVVHWNQEAEAGTLAQEPTEPDPGDLESLCGEPMDQPSNKSSFGSLVRGYGRVRYPYRRFVQPYFLPTAVGQGVTLDGR